MEGKSWEDFIGENETTEKKRIRVQNGDWKSRKKLLLLQMELLKLIIRNANNVERE